MSSSRTSPPEAPLPLTSLRRELALLETVWDLDEELAVSTDRRLLDSISIDMALAGPVSFSLWSKWLCKTRATCSPAETVSSLEESSPWDVAYMGAFPRSPLELTL